MYKTLSRDISEREQLKTIVQKYIKMRIFNKVNVLDRARRFKNTETHEIEEEWRDSRHPN